ncbi:MAG: aspartate/glutamate racemase family protein [Deltaproteobacteria bacterium]|nr:aspartate/glutamate racemase family protein [Deltaproteobacteria bacterium]
MIGIILLDTRFPRLLGDIGNPKTFPFPVLYEKVDGALPSRVVRERDASLLIPFIEAAKTLERRGAMAITTSCGFLAVWQKEMASAVEVPLFTSSLIQIPWAYGLMGRRGRIGVLTADKNSLTIDHLKGVGAEEIPSVIRGMKPDSEFHRIYVRNIPDLNYQKIEKEVIAEASALVEDHPDISAVVLECTNMAVFRKALRESTKIPVFDILTLIHYIHSSLK